jgi:hypothetical protein
MMTAELPESPVTEPVRSLEVRWIFPGQLESAVAGWFGRFPAGTESREDTYLLDPPSPGLSAKIRGGGGNGGEGLPRERGNPPGGGPRPRIHGGPAEVVLPFNLLSHDGDRPGWRPVRKRRSTSRISSASRQTAASAAGPRPKPLCEVELTAVRTRGQDWWTLGFEATGPAGLLRVELEATAALVFVQGAADAVRGNRRS